MSFLDFLKFLLSVIIGFLLSGVWFGLLVIIRKLIQKLKLTWLLHFNTLLASIIPLLCISTTLGLYPVQAREIRNVRVYVVAIVTVIITTAIITRKESMEHKEGKEMLLWGLDGLMMEIPQMLMMQSFVYGIFNLLGVSSLNLYTIIATAFIWCMGIVMQAVLSKRQLDKDLILELLSSFIFSLGIGYCYSLK